MTKINNKNDINAKVIRGKLIISSMSLDQPTLMRVNMDKTLSVTLGLKENKEDYNIVMKHADGSEDYIGSFINRQRALDSLKIISEAMFAEQRSGNKYIGRKKTSWFRKLLKVTLVIAVIFFLLFLFSLSQKHKINNNTAVTNSSPSKIGKPIPMDEFFKNK